MQSLKGITRKIIKHSNLSHKKISILLIFTCLPAWSADIIDVYGTDPKMSVKIIDQFGSRVRDIETQMNGEFINMNRGINNPEKLQQLFKQKTHIINEIREKWQFEFVDFQTVNYPGNSDIYTTIEVIQKNQPARVKLISKKIPQKNTTTKKDLIDTMTIYQKKAIRLLMTNQLDLHDNSCPVYHCTVPFKHATLQPYLNIFNQGAIHQKKLIIDTLNNDINPERRAAAAFLVGHFKNPHEIIEILSHHLDDQDDGVRNNVLRVIGETVERANLTDINTLPFLMLLDSPYETDRNKSLIILLTAADSVSGKEQIIQNEHGRLLALLRLKQPNNHNLAYMILKKISGKNFSDTNIKEWEKWTNAISSEKKPSIT